MKNQLSPPSIISLFQTVEENLHKNNINLALLGVRSILASDPQNFYAIAIERRLKRVLELRQKPSRVSNATEYSYARIIAALEHVSHMAVQHCTSLSAQASVQDMSRQMREQALENKHQALLHRARQQFHIQKYGRALQEAERARIIRPDSAEAEALIMEIKAHMETPRRGDKQQVQTEAVPMERTVTPKQVQELKSKTESDKSEAVVEKILSSVSFADYYRTNSDYTECLRHIAQGLYLDPSNEVLLQMKEEVEKMVRGKLPKKKASFQFAERR
jgi:tetratricopeptide (TPR) repeat protein